MEMLQVNIKSFGKKVFRLSSLKFNSGVATNRFKLFAFKFWTDMSFCQAPSRISRRPVLDFFHESTEDLWVSAF